MSVLALTVGVNLLVLEIVNALWLRPLPVADPGRVVTLLHARSTVSSIESSELKVFDGPVAGQVVTTGFNDAFKVRITFPQLADSLEVLGVTPSYFAVLGVSVRGRPFVDADERPGAESVAIISDRMWARGFRRDPGVIGSVVASSPRPLRIIGIASPGFEGARRGERADLWVPTRVVSDLAPSDRQLDTFSMMVFARLQPGQSIAALERRYRERLTFPDGHKGEASALPTFAPLTEVFGTSDSPSILIRERGTLAVVAGLSLLVLIGGCATIAALVLTHYEHRRQELAVKTALGAGRAVLARELISELILVWLLGSAGAIACAMVGGRLLPALSLPGGVNVGRLDLSIDWRLCAIALAAAWLTLLVAGAVPLWNATRGRLVPVGFGGTAAIAPGSVRVRQGLLALQVCATTVVLIASGLFVRTVLYSFRTGAGVDIDRTVFVTVQEKSGFLPGADPKAVAIARRTQLAEMLAELPSVRSVAGGASPIGSAALSSAPTARNIRAAGREERLLIGMLGGTPNLLATLGVPLLAGRALEDSDAASAAPMPVVITRGLAERLWGASGALGQVFSVPDLRLGSVVVVGVAENFAFGTLSRPVVGVVVTARPDSDFRVSSLVLQADDPEAVAAAIRGRFSGRIVHVETGRRIIEADIAQQRLGAWAFSGFGLVSLSLGIGGVAGLVAYLVQARRQELGVRMALGATLSDVMRHAVMVAVRPVAAGLMAGLLIGAAGSRVFAALLVGIGRLDPGTYLSVGLLTIASAIIAALSAAWRLRQLTPSDALRRG